ncbi:Armadillo-type fold [Trinorchestia longiramus]|nr:Armadillo-type fold [Trinorchestia longiramus]
MSVLECCSAEEELYIAPCLLYLCPYPRYAQAQLETKTQKGPLTVTLHGSLILQELLQFFKPIKLVRSLLQIDTPELLRLMQDPKGSHVIDAFCSSEHIGPKSWGALVSKIQAS